MRALLYITFIIFSISCEKQIDAGELFLPDGFSSKVFVDSLSQNIRHITVNTNGDLYAKYKSLHNNNSLAAIRDNDNDGIADSISHFGKFKIESKKNNFKWASLL